MAEAVAFIDWISYTRANDTKLLPYPSDFAEASREVVWEWQRFNETEDSQPHEVIPVKPNKPFANARMDDYTKSRIEWGGGSTRVLCSFGGQACKVLRARGRTQEVLKNVCSDVTRIDLSVDIRTETKPMEFCGKRDKQKHKTGAFMFSEEGETQYVGSWSSDRFCRVYRYNPPHERSAFLRVEHVFKGRQAKAVAARLVDVHPSAIIEDVGNIYGWAHPDWLAARRLSATPENVVWYKEERHISKTAKWLAETAAPSLVRLVKEGEIVDLQEWLKINVYDKLLDDGRDISSPSSSSGG